MTENTGKKIEFSNGKTILDLREALFEVSGLERDHRWKNWTKEIIRVNKRHSNGWMYEGNLVQDGTVEIDDANKVYLVASELGSNKYCTTYYVVVVLRDGVLQKTNIEDSSKVAGWAIRMREPVTNLLKKLSNKDQSPSPRDELLTLISNMNDEQVAKMLEAAKKEVEKAIGESRLRDSLMSGGAGL